MIVYRIEVLPNATLLRKAVIIYCSHFSLKFLHNRDECHGFPRVVLLRFRYLTLNQAYALRRANSRIVYFPSYR